MTTSPLRSEPVVRQFSQVLLWPLQLAPGAHSPVGGQAWSVLEGAPGAWQPAVGDFAGAGARFGDRAYGEFVTFLPYVQRFLYGEGAQRGTNRGASAIRVFERSDVRRARVVLEPGARPLDLEVSRVELCFFVDIDVVILAVQVNATDLPLGRAEALMLRLGRAYPAAWHADGHASRCPDLVEWLDAEGRVLARSDYADRQRYLDTVARLRVPCIARHWEWLLQPLVPEYAGLSDGLTYLQLEYYRFPMMVFLSLDQPGALARPDFIRLGLGSGPGGGALPFASAALHDFERQYCDDRYWAPEETHPWPNTRFICTGHTFLVLGEHGNAWFIDREAGVRGQFERQYFTLALIAHFHKAALLMLSDRLVVTLSRLDVRDVESIKLFKRAIRRAMATFLGFAHRYWFNEISTQDQARDLFQMWRRHLGTERLYAEVREEIHDMNEYLNSDSLRRQANTVVRLTVVTTLGLIGTIATGVLGMNVFASAHEPWPMKALIFAVVLALTMVLVFYTVQRSRKLAELLERVSEDNRDGVPRKPGGAAPVPLRRTPA